MSAPPVSLTDQIRCVEREISMRVRMYPVWIASRRLKQETADRELEHMRAVLRTLRQLRAGTPGPADDLFREITP